MTHRPESNQEPFYQSSMDHCHWSHRLREITIVLPRRPCKNTLFPLETWPSCKVAYTVLAPHTKRRAIAYFANISTPATERVRAIRIWERNVDPFWTVSRPRQSYPCHTIAWLIHLGAARAVRDRVECVARIRKSLPWKWRRPERVGQSS